MVSLKKTYSYILNDSYKAAAAGRKSLSGREKTEFACRYSAACLFFLQNMPLKIRFLPLSAFTYRIYCAFLAGSELSLLSDSFFSRNGQGPYPLSFSFYPHSSRIQGRSHQTAALLQAVLNSVRSEPVDVNNVPAVYTVF